MPDEVLKGFLRIGLLVGVCGFTMIFLQPLDSAQFVLSVCSALIGFTLVGGVIAVSRLLKR